MQKKTKRTQTPALFRYVLDGAEKPPKGPISATEFESSVDGLCTKHVKTKTKV